MERLTVKKFLVEIEYNENRTTQGAIETAILYTVKGVSSVKGYKNKDDLTVDEASKQCLECPAYFTQEANE